MSGESNCLKHWDKRRLGGLLVSHLSQKMTLFHPKAPTENKVSLKKEFLFL